MNLTLDPGLLKAARAALNFRNQAFIDGRYCPSASGKTYTSVNPANGKAHRFAREIRAGVLAVNCFGEGDLTTPFGGFKQSGFFGRDKSIFAHYQYTELKTVWMQLS